MHQTPSVFGTCSGRSSRGFIERGLKHPRRGKSRSILKLDCGLSMGAHLDQKATAAEWPSGLPVLVLQLRDELPLLLVRVDGEGDVRSASLLRWLL